MSFECNEAKTNKIKEKRRQKKEVKYLGKKI